jgi:hypothetical protein
MSSLICLNSTDAISLEQKQVSRLERLLNGLGLTIALAVLAAAASSQPGVYRTPLVLQELFNKPVQVSQPLKF